MPKIKSHRGAAKRCKKTASGKFLRAKAFKRHILTSKPTRRKRHMRGTQVVSVATTTLTGDWMFLSVAPGTYVVRVGVAPGDGRETGRYTLRVR